MAIFPDAYSRVSSLVNLSRWRRMMVPSSSTSSEQSVTLTDRQVAMCRSSPEPKSYAVNDKGRFNPEYAEVYGVPFSFIPCSGTTTDPKPGPLPTRVRAIESRIACEITFPRLVGYRYDLADEPLTHAFSPLLLSTAAPDNSGIPFHRWREVELRANRCDALHRRGSSRPAHASLRHWLQCTTGCHRSTV